MNQNSLQELIRSGLPTLKAGGRVAANAADEISTSATDPELKSFLDTGNDTAEQWQARIDRAMQEAGTSEEGENEILEAHFRVSKQIRDAAPDDQVRDLGIIAASQLALHYWIAAFGSMAAYAKQAGIDQTAQEIGQSLDEAKQADEASVQLVTRIMS